MGFLVYGRAKRAVDRPRLATRARHKDKTMVNRIERWMNEEEVPANYWIVSSEVGNFAVSADEADRLLGVLNASDARAWVHFQDLFGSRYRLRAQRIDAVWESTAEQRQRERRFTRERRSEAKRDRRPWEEE